jgi:hypothetical protein
MTEGKLMPPFHEWRDSMVARGKLTICLRHAVFNPPGSGSPITKDKGFDSKCRDSAMVQAFAAYTLQKLGVVARERDAKQALAVTFISRKDYKFNTNMNMQRKIDNEAEVRTMGGVCRRGLTRRGAGCGCDTGQAGQQCRGFPRRFRGDVVEGTGLRLRPPPHPTPHLLPRLTHTPGSWRRTRQATF